MTRERQELLPDKPPTGVSRSLTTEAVPCAAPPQGGVGQVLFCRPLGGGVWSGLGSTLLLFCKDRSPRWRAQGKVHEV